MLQVSNLADGIDVVHTLKTMTRSVEGGREGGREGGKEGGREGTGACELQEPVLATFYESSCDSSSIVVLVWLSVGTKWSSASSHPVLMARTTPIAMS